MFTNKINKKIYIGKTINWKQRKRVHKYSAKKPTYAFAKALNKHGWENFKREILITDVPEEDLLNLETCYIEVYNSTNPDIGYNMSQSMAHTKNHSVEGGGSISFKKKSNRFIVTSKSPEQRHVGYYNTKNKAEEALDLYNRTGEIIPSDSLRRKSGSGTITFLKKTKKWKVNSKRPECTHVGLYLTKEKSEEALDLYNTTGERMPSDVKTRRRGTGSISTSKSGQFEAKFKGKYIGTFDTSEKAEEALALYNRTGKCIQSDLKIRRSGTGCIRKQKSGRFRAKYKMKNIGTFDTEAEAEEALEKLWRD